MMHYPQTQLPFETDRITQPYLAVGANNPPFVPPVQCDPQLMSYVPAIAGLAAQEIQNKAQSNPLRTFMFNQYAVNNYANDAFASLVIVVVDCVTLMVFVKREYTSFEQAISVAVPWVVEMLCAMNLQQFPALEQRIPPQALNDIRNSMLTFNKLVQEITGMKNNMRYQQSPVNVGQPVSGWNTGGGWNANAGGGALVSPSNNPSTLFSGNRTSAMVPNSSRSSRWDGDSRFERRTHERRDTHVQDVAEILTQPFTNKQGVSSMNQPQSGNQATEVAVTGTRALASSGEIKWKPSAEYPYLPAYNPTTHTLYLNVLPDGTIQPELERINSAMDEKLHTIPTVFGPVPPALDLSQRAAVLERIENEIAIASGIEPQPEEHETPEPTTFVSSKGIAETSEATAWLLVDLDRLAKNDNHSNPDVFRAYAQIATPVVSLRDETEVVKNLGSSNTLLELREKLNSYAEEITPALWSQANRKITNAINRIVRQHLSIPDLQMESFVHDIEDLINYLAENFGEVIKNALVKNQKRIIRQTFATLSENTSKDLRDNLINSDDYEEDAMPKITYIASNYTLTYLNCRSHELEIELSSTTSATVTDRYTPVLHAILDKLFQEVEQQSDPIDRHLIRTNDGRVMEACKGYLGDKFYLLTLVE